MYQGYEECMNCKTKLVKKNFGGGHKIGYRDKPDLVEAVCLKCQPFFENIRSDRIRKAS